MLSSALKLQGGNTMIQVLVTGSRSKMLRYLLPNGVGPHWLEVLSMIMPVTGGDRILLAW